MSFQEPKYPVQIAAARGAPSCVPVPCVPAPRAPRAARNPKLLSGGCRAAGGGGGRGVGGGSADASDRAAVRASGCSGRRSMTARAGWCSPWGGAQRGPLLHGGARGAAGGAWGQPCRRAAQAQRLSASHAVVSVL